MTNVHTPPPTHPRSDGDTAADPFETMDSGLQRIGAEMNAALSSMSDAIWIADAHGRTLRVNDAFLKTHRFQESHDDCMLRLEEYFDLFHVCRPDGQAVEHAQWPGACALRGESGTSLIYQLQRRDTGETWFMSYSYAPILSDGSAQIAGAVVTSRDVTEQLRMQREI